MKKILLVCVIACFCESGISAQKVIWTDDRIDCMYTGIANILPLSFEGVDELAVDIQVSDGTVEKNDNGQYVWRITQVGDKGILTVKYKSKEIARFELPRN